MNWSFFLSLSIRDEWRETSPEDHEEDESVLIGYEIFDILKLLDMVDSIQPNLYINLQNKTSGPIIQCFAKPKPGGCNNQFCILSPKVRDGKSLQNSTRKTLSLKNLHTKYLQIMTKTVQN